MSRSPPVVINFSESLGSSMLLNVMRKDYQYYRKKRDIMGMLANVRNHRDMEDLYYHFDLSQDLLRNLARNKVGIEHLYNVYLKHGWYWTIVYIVNLPLDEVKDQLVNMGFNTEMINVIQSAKRLRDAGYDNLTHSNHSMVPFSRAGYNYNQQDANSIIHEVFGPQNVLNARVGAYDLSALNNKTIRRYTNGKDVELWLSNLVPYSDMEKLLRRYITEIDSKRVELQVDDRGYPIMYRYRRSGESEYVEVKFENDEIVSVSIPEFYFDGVRGNAKIADVGGVYYCNNYMFVHSIMEPDPNRGRIYFTLLDEKYRVKFELISGYIEESDNIETRNIAANSNNIITKAGLKFDVGYYLLRELVKINSPSKYCITHDIFTGDIEIPNRGSVIYNSEDGLIFRTDETVVNISDIEDPSQYQEYRINDQGNVDLGAYKDAIVISYVPLDRYFYVNGMKYAMPKDEVELTVLVKDAPVVTRVENANTLESMMAQITGVLIEDKNVFYFFTGTTHNPETEIDWSEWSEY